MKNDQKTEQSSRRRLLRPAILGDFSLRDYVRTRNFWIRVLVGIALIVVARYTNLGFLGWGLFVCFAVLLSPIPAKW